MHLKVAYTKVIYQSYHLPAAVLVLPSKITKEAFDDIGFLVVDDKSYSGSWPTVKLFDTTNRTDDNFQWFEDLNLPEEESTHIVVGYAVEKSVMIPQSAAKKYDLTQLEVIVNLNICPEILGYHKKLSFYHAPCYHSCSVKEFNIDNLGPKCSKYHGSLGSVILNVDTNKALGITTWGPTILQYELPVGLAVPNTNSFFEDLTCARKIKKLSLEEIATHYQALCE